MAAIPPEVRINVTLGWYGSRELLNRRIASPVSPGVFGSSPRSTVVGTAPFLERSGLAPFF